ncbi:hypothetical protein LCGC14_0310600 [marine sediment metagenome]|uniref:Uncharacterized protein n=1 Tax=marine sediment metagenome TaxID=412755 RepID=A0A0F9U4M3_9ZZZZ
MLRLYPDETGDTPASDDSAEDDAPKTTSESTEEEASVEPDTDQTSEDESETAPDPDAETKEEEEADDAGELDDETIDALGEAYKDRFLKSKPLADEVSKQVRREVERQVSQRVRSVETESRSGDLVTRGKLAAKAVADFATEARAELAKAAKQEDFRSDIVDPEKVVGHLSDYGTAVSAHVSGQFDSAVEKAWASVFDGDEGLSELSEDQAGELAEMVETFRRMEGDARQAEAAKPYFFTSLFRTLVGLGRAEGQEIEKSRASKAKTAGEKIVGKNAVAAAKAKLAKEKAPPKTPKSSGPITGNLEDQYDKAVAAGNTTRAQSIVDQLSKQGWLGEST